MSFQDVGRHNSNRRTANATMKPGATITAPAVVGGGTRTGTSSVSQISESLTQYQRNVGILEKIAQQLLASTTHNASRSELEQQYKVQLDVLRQLEQRLKDQFLAQRKVSTSSNKQTWMKLERDFERVQATAQSCKVQVTKQEKQLQQRASVQQEQTAQTVAAHALQQEQQLLQQQLQQDTLHEEIMREREAEIQTINQGMHTVNQIYKDLANIVGTQQEDIDTIENQMGDAKSNAESGLSQVQKANEKYNQSQCVVS